MENYYSDNLKEQLFLYKFNPDKRDELYDIIMLRNKNKLFKKLVCKNEFFILCAA